VEVAVRLGWEARHDLRDPALAYVGGDISRMKSLRSGVAFVIVSRRLIQCIRMSGLACSLRVAGERS
jgi:hypothetical protein